MNTGWLDKEDEALTIKSVGCCQAAFQQIVAISLNVAVFASSKHEGLPSCIGSRGSPNSTSRRGDHSNHSSMAMLKAAAQ